VVLSSNNQSLKVNPLEYKYTNFILFLVVISAIFAVWNFWNFFRQQKTWIKWNLKPHPQSMLPYLVPPSKKASFVSYLAFLFLMFLSVAATNLFFNLSIDLNRVAIILSLLIPPLYLLKRSIDAEPELTGIYSTHFQYGDHKIYWRDVATMTPFVETKGTKTGIFHSLMVILKKNSIERSGKRSEVIINLPYSKDVRQEIRDLMMTMVDAKAT